MICQSIADVPSQKDVCNVYKTFNYYFTIVDDRPDVINDPTYRVKGAERPERSEEDEKTNQMKQDTQGIIIPTYTDKEIMEYNEGKSISILSPLDRAMVSICIFSRESYDMCNVVGAYTIDSECSYRCTNNIRRDCDMMYDIYITGLSEGDPPPKLYQKEELMSVSVWDTKCSRFMFTDFTKNNPYVFSNYASFTISDVSDKCTMTCTKIFLSNDGRNRFLQDINYCINYCIPCRSTDQLILKDNKGYAILLKNLHEYIYYSNSISRFLDFFRYLKNTDHNKCLTISEDIDKMTISFDKKYFL